MTIIRFDSDADFNSYSRVRDHYAPLIAALRSRGTRMDAGETAIIQRGLDYVKKVATDGIVTQGAIQWPHENTHIRH